MTDPTTDAVAVARLFVYETMGYADAEDRERLLDAYRDALLAAERARVRAVVLNAHAVHWIADNDAISRVDLLARLDAEGA